MEFPIYFNNECNILVRVRGLTCGVEFVVLRWW